MSHNHQTETAAVPKAYAGTLLVLLVLTGITVSAAGIHFGSNSINIAIALGIATIKASLVALVFMHLRHDKPVNAIIAISGFLFLALLLAYCVIDIDTRKDMVPYTAKVPVKAAPASPARGAAH
jgi:cytochrome c oxidase subunit IV